MTQRHFFGFSRAIHGVFVSLFIVLARASCSNTGKIGGGVAAAAFSSDQAASGKVIADLKAYRIAYYEPVAGEEGRPAAIQESDEPFVVSAFGPQDTLPAEIKKPSIYAVFSQPVVPLAKLGDPITETANLFTIEPALTGTYRWYGTKLLSFEPDVDGLPQQKYTVTVSDAIKSLGGKALTGQKTFSFETDRLEALSWGLGPVGAWTSSYSAEPEDARFINAVFSYPVDLDEIAKWIEIKGGTGAGGGSGYTFKVVYQEKPAKEYRLKNADDKQFVTIIMDKTPPLDTDMTVSLKAGARSKAGWLGTKEDASYKFHTLRPFAYEYTSARSYSSPRTRQAPSIPINVAFNYEVEKKGAEKFFSIDGLPPLQPKNIKIYGGSVVINELPLQYETAYTLRISSGLKDTRGRALGKDETVEVQVEAANSYVSVYDRGPGVLEAAYPARYPWEVQNPYSISKTISGANSPYERALLGAAEPVDTDVIPRNEKYYFMEDLAPYLGPGGKGSVKMAWAYETASQWDKNRLNKGDTWLTVQVTDIGITTRYAYNEVLVWATRLSTGAPVADAAVSLYNGTDEVAQGKTDKQGLAVFDFPNGGFVSKFAPPRVLSNNAAFAGSGLRIKVIEGGGAAAGGDEADFIPNDSHNLWRFDIYSGIDPFSAEKDRPVIFLFTDRGLYKPGETVTFRGVDRILSWGKYQAYAGPYTVTAMNWGHNAAPLATVRGTASKNGGSYGSFTLPAALDPGTYTIRYSRNNEITQTITFTVANFERLRFEASLKAPDMTFYQGDRLSMRFAASYLAGGALAGAPYSYYWTRENAWFTPRSSDGQRAGQWEHWRFGPENSDGRSYVANGEGVLGPDGSADIGQIAGADGIEGAAYSYRLEATAQDASRQAISSQASVIVHPASFYIGTRLDNKTIAKIADIDKSSASAWFLAAGSPATLSWALVAPDGSAASMPDKGTITAQLIRYDWKQSRQAGVGGRINVSWERVEEVAEEKVITPGKDTSGVWQFTPKESGQWEVRLRSKDAKNRPIVTRMGFYVSGGGWVHWGSDDVDAITLTPDKNSYAAGETAKLLVRSPLPKGKYLLTIEREGILSNKIIDLDGSARTIEVPITENYVPIVYVALSSYSVRTGKPQNTYYEPDLDKPHGVFGIASLRIDTEPRKYAVEVEAGKGVYRPAEQAEVKIRVTNKGKPVAGAEVTFMAVDRGVVDLIDYHVPNPLDFFYNPGNFPLGVRGADSRSLLIDPVTYSLSDLQGGDEEDSSKMDERSDFRPTAVFEPALITGADGTVTVKFGLPDSLTTYRCTAVAVGTQDFGIVEQDLRVSAPLTATAALPRKLRWRDTGTVSLILTNLEKSAVKAAVSLETANSDEAGENLWGNVLAVDDEKTKNVEIAAGATAEVQFRVAAVGVGESKLTFTLTSPLVNERIIKPLLVDRPVVFETVSTIGSLGSDPAFIEEGVVLPSFVPEGTGSLSVTLAASRLAQLKEAVRYLLSYPYGCLEQRTAALLPLVAFGDYIEAFELDSPVKNPKKVIEAELANIAKSRLGDGSYPYWPGGGYTNPMVTLRVAHIVLLAKAKGYAIPADINVTDALKSLNNPKYAWLQNDPFLKGYWLWVRAMNGSAAQVSAETADFLKQGDKLGISGYGFAGLAALEAGDKKTAQAALTRIKQFLRPGTRTVDLTDTYETGGNFWGYDADRYAIALMLHYSLAPQDDMTTRLAGSLIERQRKGVWSNTASSFWAILAYGRIADAESAEKTDIRAAVTLGGKPFHTAAFTSYGGVPSSAVKSFADPPLLDARRDTLLPLRIQREGSGVLYYTASLRYGIPAELATMRDEGISVFAETFDADGNKVSAAGGLSLVAGKTYTRRVTVSTSKDRTFLALRAPVPSGAEIVDATFVTSSEAPPKAQEADESYNYWQAVPLRFIMDDEVRFHWDFFRSGRQTVEFRFRAVMPGVYPTPPSQAECMYEGEIFGRSNGELARIREAKG
jgi:uncharacterized protein YfaS (alpha-2-macroglobulin family)